MKMKSFGRGVLWVAGIAGAGAIIAAEQSAEPPKHDAGDTEMHCINILPDQMKWNRIFPEAGDKSAELTMLHVDKKTGASHLMIRMPKSAHAPKHWHSANETHVLLSGKFVMECSGKREVLTPGAFNFMPAKLQHEAWTTDDEGAVLYITVDGPWDINWVNGPPKPEDLVGGAKDK